MTIDHTAKQMAEDRLKGRCADARRLPQGQALPAGRGYDASWFRATLEQRSITALSLSVTNRNVTIPHSAALYRQRLKVENVFEKL